MFQELKDILSADEVDEEAYLEQTKDTLRERLRAIYVAGTHNQLAVLLSADDYTDFLARTELMRGVTEHDTQLMNEINAQIQQINEKKADSFLCLFNSVVLHFHGSYDGSTASEYFNGS